MSKLVFDNTPQRSWLMEILGFILALGLGGSIFLSVILLGLYMEGKI